MKITDKVILATLSMAAIVVIIHEYGIYRGGLAVLMLLLLLSLTSLFLISFVTFVDKEIAFNRSSYKAFILPSVSTLICLALAYSYNTANNIGAIAALSFVIAFIYTIALKIMNRRKR
jgi:hypothetical protein